MSKTESIDLNEQEAMLATGALMDYVERCQGIEPMPPELERRANEAKALAGRIRSLQIMHIPTY